MKYHLLMMMTFKLLQLNTLVITKHLQFEGIFCSACRLVICSIFLFHALHYSPTNIILQIHYYLFMYHQINSTPENNPEHNRHSKVGTSDTNSYCRKQQR